MNAVEKHLFARFLEPDETVEYIIHRDPSVDLVRYFWKFLVFWVLPTAAYLYYPHEYIWYAIWGFLVIGIYTMIQAILTWYSDVFILSEECLIDVIWHGFFSTSSVRFNYKDIESVKVDTEDFFQTMFGFGNIKIETSNSDSFAILKDAMDIKIAQEKLQEIRQAHILKSQPQDANLETFKEALYQFVKEYTEKATKEALEKQKNEQSPALAEEVKLIRKIKKLNKKK